MKRLLFILLTIVLTLGLAVPMAVPAAAAAPANEVLYYVDSNGSNPSELYQVALDGATNEANLTLLPNGTLPFHDVFAIACTPDGARIYAIQSPGAGATPKLGYYDVAAATFTTIGNITSITGVSQAAFSPGGILYITTDGSDSLYSVDTGTAAATLVGLIKRDTNSVIVDVSAGDVAFDHAGNLYLWTNGSRGTAPNNAPAGLYNLTLPASPPGDVTAHYLGSLVNFSGLAVRANGFGDLVGSRGLQSPGKMRVVSKTNGSQIGSEFTTKLGGVNFATHLGDMTSGRIFATITVKAQEDSGPTSLSVSIPWSKTGGITPNSGTGTTTFNILNADGNVTLTAPVTHTENFTFYVFKNWDVDGSPYPNGQNSITFTVTGDATATAHYTKVISVDKELTYWSVDPDEVPLGTLVYFEMTITVHAYAEVSGVTVTDGIGADLVVDSVAATPPATYAKAGKGKMGATVVTWPISTPTICIPYTAVIDVHTGLNPNGKQEYTSIDGHYLNSGPVVYFTYGGTPYMLQGPPVMVTVVSP